MIPTEENEPLNLHDWTWLLAGGAIVVSLWGGILGLLATDWIIWLLYGTPSFSGGG